jgi:hypothetical protein
MVDLGLKMGWVHISKIIMILNIQNTNIFSH